MSGRWGRKVRKLGRGERTKERKEATLFGHWGKGKEQREGEKGLKEKGRRGLREKLN